MYRDVRDGTYNDYLENNLSYKNRFVVIKRSDYRKLYPEYRENLLNEISSDEVDDRIKDITSDKQLYLKYADGRDDGLCDMARY